MTSPFPTPWRIVEIQHGFSVDGATGRQLGVFYGRADPNTAGHTGFLTIAAAGWRRSDDCAGTDVERKVARSVWYL
jgi:hypothetical protein